MERRLAVILVAEVMGYSRLPLPLVLPAVDIRKFSGIVGKDKKCIWRLHAKYLVGGWNKEVAL